MSRDSDNSAPDSGESTSPGDTTQSPTISSPIKLQSKKRRLEEGGDANANIPDRINEINDSIKIPTALPFSDTTYDSETRQVPSEVEGDDSDELIIRGTKETQDLQIRLFQLKMERKNLVDELRRRIPGYEDEERAGNQDSEFPDISLNSKIAAQNDLPENNVRHRPQSTETQNGHVNTDELESDNSRLVAENHHLREKIDTLSVQKQDALRKESQFENELNRLRSLLGENDLILKRLKNDKLSQERIINAERSRAKLLQESKRQADETIRRLRERSEINRETGGYLRSDEIYSKFPPDTRIEKLEIELEKAKIEKSQIRDLLLEERSITEDLQQHLDQLQTENSGQEALNNDRSLELEGLRSQNLRLVQEKEETQKQNNNLIASLKRSQTKCSDLIKDVGEYEKKVSELQLLTAFKDKHIEEKSKLLTEKQEKINQMSSELELKYNEIRHLDEQLKQLEISRVALQHNLDESRAELSSARTSMKSKGTRLEKLEAEVRHKSQELEKANESMTQTRNEAEKEITLLRTEIMTANNTIESLTKEHEINLEKFSQTYSLQLERQSQEAQAKLSTLQTKYSSLSVQSTDLKREIISKEAEREDLVSQNQELLARIEKYVKDLKDAEKRSREIDEELQDLHSKHNATKSEVRMKSLELQQKSQMQDVLTSRVQELEKTISNQSVQLNQFSSSEIGKLKRTAEENSHAVGELTRLKVEWEAKYNEWLRYHEYAESIINKLTIAKSELETQLNTLQSNEAQREKLFRENVQIEYDNQFNYVKAELEYKVNSLEKRIGCVSADLMSTRSEKDQALNQLHQLESALQEKFNEVRRFEKEMTNLSHQVSAATEYSSTISSEKTLLSSEVEALSAKIKEYQNNHDIQHAKIARLEKDLNAKEITLQESQHTLSQLEEEFSKLKHYSALMSHHAWNFVNYSLNEIQKLLFVKKMYTRLLPRIDLTPTTRNPSPRTSPARSLRRSFLIALAIVRFRNAAREGLKRKCSESQEFVRGHYSQ